MLLPAMRFSGTYTALITPFRDGAIDVPAFQALIERQIAGGVDGIIPVRHHRRVAHPRYRRNTSK